MMAFIPAWAWRWIMIVVLVVAWSGFVAFKVHEHDQEKFDEFKAEVQRAGDAQNAKTAATVKAWKALKEASDVEAQLRNDRLNAQLASAKRLLNDPSRSILPAPAAGSSGSDRLCLSREELDRGLRAALGRLQERSLANAAEGQRGVDVAVVCKRWAEGLVRP